MIAELLWYMQNCDLIRSLFLMNEQHIFSRDLRHILTRFELRAHKQQVLWVSSSLSQSTTKFISNFCHNRNLIITPLGVVVTHARYEILAASRHLPWEQPSMGMSPGGCYWNYFPGTMSSLPSHSNSLHKETRADEFTSTYSSFNTLRPRQNGRHFADDIFKWIFFSENVWISLKISLKFVPKVLINNIPALVQIMAWHRPLSKPTMVSLVMHIRVTQPQWVKLHYLNQIIGYQVKDSSNDCIDDMPTLGISKPPCLGHLKEI